ncbi:MAG: hypothetical protein ACFCVC_15480 [Acidimicrobiia bacterium]
MRSSCCLTTSEITPWPFRTTTSFIVS